MYGKIFLKKGLTFWWVPFILLLTVTEGNENMTTMTKFETVVCGRCGGTGHYSFNQIDGTMCYGCRGVGAVYTKRGLEAKRFFDESLSVPAKDVNIGDFIQCWAGDPKYYKVTDKSYETINDGRVCVQLVMSTDKYHCVYRSNQEQRIKVHTDTQTKQAKLKAALEYQETLTKAGKVKKSDKK